MAGTTKTMEQIRKILLQRHQGVSIRKIASQSNVARNTIRSYLRKIAESVGEPQDALALSDEDLAKLLFFEPDKEQLDPRYSALSERLSHYASELKRPHVTRQVLWEEYCEQHPTGYGYTRFCYHLNAFIGQKDVTAVFEHVPGEKMMIDFAGDGLCYTDKQTGEVVKCAVLVTVLPFSSYMYVEALPSQAQEHLVKGLSNALQYLGGVPQCLVSDNLRSVVKKADRYEPSFTELMDQLSVYYQTTFMATRVRKPRDKATVETSVRVAYQRIYSRLRNIEAFSLGELNDHIQNKLETLNARNFKGRDYSRTDLFIQYEKANLKPLPAVGYEVKKSTTSKVQRNYHVILGENMHQYSVPWRYVGKQTKIVYTADTVEIYHDHCRIALHVRNYRRYGYSTLKEHMPQNHKAIAEQKGWDAKYFISQADKIGPTTKLAMTEVLKSKAFPEQTFNTCLGILRLESKYGSERLERACALMIGGPKINFGILKNILKNNMDKQDISTLSKDFTTPQHENIRGPQQLLF